MKLFQLSGQTAQTSDVNPALQTVAINEMRLASQIFEHAEFYSMQGSADTPPSAAATYAGSSRAVNNDYAGATTAASTVNVALKIIGDTIKTDMAYERRGQGIESERLRQLRTSARAIGRHFMDLTVNGDAANVVTDFSGLKTQIALGTSSLILGGGADGAQVLFGSDNTAKKSQQAFLYYLDQLIAKVGGASCLIMNATAISYLKAIGREYINVQSSEAALGQLVESYNGVPIVNSGYNHDLSAEVITNTETTGINADCSSIYAVRFGEKMDTTFATNVGVQVRDRGLVGSQYVTMFDFDVDLAILNALSAWRLEGIRFA